MIDQSETLPPRPDRDSSPPAIDPNLAATKSFHADSSILEKLTLPPRGAAQTTGSPPGPQVRRFGDYELLEEIARGGMGVVYKARQVSLDRVVAIKMILAGQFASERDVERFYTEARAAANLQHPNIVAIHEVGQHEGQHYFTMDYVEGKNLAQVARQNPLSLVKAAGYVKTIAEAIDFAHRHGILHRDLKPANVLIDTFDQPRVTDFGLAKQIENSAQLTSTGAVMGTPSYMPPEQAGAHGGMVSPASDVYSMGAILYELVTGRAPFVADSLIATLSMVLNTDPLSPRVLNDKVPRDLETICLKCLQKEPRNRYITAAELADDLGRFLRHEPVLARPVGDLERAWRLCRRNPAVASLMAAVAAALVGGTIVSTWFAVEAKREATRADEQRKKAEDATLLAREQRRRADGKADEAKRAAHRAEQETDRARLERTNATEVSKFLVSLFQTSDPLGIRGTGFAGAGEKGAAVTAGEILSRGATRIQQENLQPLVKATLMAEVGNVYRSLGRYDRAEPLVRGALKLREEHKEDERNPTDPADLASSLVQVAWLEHDRGNYSGAEKLFRGALAIQRRQKTKDPLALAETEFNLAWTLADADHLDEARELFKKVLDVRHEKLGKKDRRVVLAEIGLISVLLAGNKDRDALLQSVHAFDQKDVVRAFFLYQQARSQRDRKNFGESERAYQAVLQIARQQAPPDHPVLALLLGDYAGLLGEKGDYVGGRKAARECLDIATRSLGEHPKMVEPMRVAARELIDWGAFNEAERLLDRAWTICNRRMVHEKEYQTEFILQQMVRVHREAGEYDQAELWARRGSEFAHNHWQKGSGPRELSTDLCAILCERGKLDEACARLRDHVERIRDIGTCHERVCRLCELADCLRAAGRYDEARRTDREARALFDEGWKRGDLAFPGLLFRSPDEVADLQQKLVLKARGSEPYRSDPDPLRFLGDRLEPYGEQLLAAHRFADAERAFQEAIELRTKVYHQDHITSCRALRGLSEAVAGQGRNVDAETLLRRVLSLERTSYGDGHINVANAEIDLARCLVREGKKTEGIRLVREAQALAEKALGPHHAWLPPLYRKIAPLLDECGQQNEAEALLRDAWTFDQAKFPVNHPRLMNSALLYSAHLSERGRLPESEAVLRELHDQYGKELPKDSWRAMVVGMRLGSILTAERKFDESERLLTDAKATLVRGFDPSDAPVVESRALLARLYRAWGKPEKAKP